MIEPAAHLLDLGGSQDRSGHEHDLARGEGVQLVLDRLHRIGVANPAAGFEAGGSERTQRDREHPLGLVARRREVGGPAVEARRAGGRHDQQLQPVRRRCSSKLAPSLAISISSISSGSSSASEVTTSRR